MLFVHATYILFQPTDPACRIYEMCACFLFS